MLAQQRSNASAIVVSSESRPSQKPQNASEILHRSSEEALYSIIVSTWQSDPITATEVCLSLPRSWGVESNLSFGFFGVVEMGSAVVVEPGLAGLL